MTELPDLRDVLTDDGRELPPIRLTPTQLAEAQDFVGTWGQGPMTCTCGHTIADHRPVTDEWLVGGITAREECTECECTDFEEESNA